MTELTAATTLEDQHRLLSSLGFTARQLSLELPDESGCLAWGHR